MQDPIVFNNSAADNFCIRSTQVMVEVRRHTGARFIPILINNTFLVFLQVDPSNPWTPDEATMIRDVLQEFPIDDLEYIHDRESVVIMLDAREHTDPDGNGPPFRELLMEAARRRGG